MKWLKGSTREQRRAVGEPVDETVLVSYGSRVGLSSGNLGIYKYFIYAYIRFVEKYSFFRFNSI